MLPLPLKIWLVSWFRKKTIRLSSNKQAFIFLAADYGNIGDIGISQAQHDFLKKELNGFDIVSVPISQTRLVLRSIQKQIKPDDIVTIIGGGNMGAIYPDIEALRQLVIKSCPHNRIVCFPQTLDWDDSLKSNRALQRLVTSYSRHPDIHVFARESITHTKLNEIFSPHYNVSVGLVPDIVMTSTAEALGTKECIDPSGILRCLRDDKEAALSVAQYAILDAALAITGYSIKKTDTHAGGSELDAVYCAALLADKLGQFRAAKLVVTDRLHGMILSLLSGTPCLVIPNANHKISQTWRDWLRDHPRLVFVEPKQFGELPTVIHKLLAAPRGALNESPVDMGHYRTLKQALNRL